MALRKKNLFKIFVLCFASIKSILSKTVDFIMLDKLASNFDSNFTLDSIFILKSILILGSALIFVFILAIFSKNLIIKNI